MLANSRTESEIRRAKCEIASITKMNALPKMFMSSRPGRQPARQVAEEALRPDALDVVARTRRRASSTSGIERFAVAA